MRNITLGARITTDLLSSLDELAKQLNCGRSNLIRYALHTLILECNRNQTTFNYTKSNIF